MQFSLIEDGTPTYPDYYRNQLVPTTKYHLERGGEMESFSIHPTAIDVDLNIQLFIDLINWKKSIASYLPIQVTELQNLEKRIEKMNAIENVFGILNDLTSEQLEAFETSIKRRPLFK